MLRAPRIETKRFDTMFYVTGLPPAQHAEHDGAENIDSLWVEPAEALEMAARDEISLPPPTGLNIAEALGLFGRVITPVHPDTVDREGISVLTVPGEATHFALRDGRWQPLQP